MAYQARPLYGPPDHEQKSHHFMARPPPHYSAQYPPPAVPMNNAQGPDISLLDPESESSDVSDNPGEDYHDKLQSAIPASLPPPASKRTLESSDAIETRLRDIQRVEDYNFKKQAQLRAKRDRKDERIRRKREAQDFRIRAIMDARTRRDERIQRRRRDEDAAFQRIDQETEEEEMYLRRVLKRLKRGLPVDEAISQEQNQSSATVSPPPSTYNSVPPPKRHQPGPPGITNSPQMGHRPSSQDNVSTQPPPLPPSGSLAASRPPSHQFVPATHAVGTGPFGPMPTYAHPQSPAAASGSPFAQYPRPNMPNSDANPYGRNGQQASSQLTRPIGVPPPSSGPNPIIAPVQPPPPTSALDTMPPRHATSTYDTRPPPVTSGFASVNAPPNSGFATINARTIGTPPVPPSSLVHSSVAGQNHSQGSIHSPFPHHIEVDQNNSHPRPYGSESTPMASSLSSSGFGKRTPSTTHPYQMSEAFANRHHHCERTDRLSRGIWTFFGPGGTNENPTVQKQEMYLRCNHDGCSRIDWRTVHGLQCHIVKSHEQPKGTINSLEKALDRYGVPVTEVEEYERIHGEGSAGTMADSKQGKIFKKARDSMDPFDPAGKFTMPVPVPDLAYRANMVHGSAGTTATSDSRSTPNAVVHLATSGSANGGADAPMPLSTTSTPYSLNKFAAVNGVWGATLPTKPTEPKDVEMTDAPLTPSDGSPTANKNVRSENRADSSAPNAQGATPKASSSATFPPVQPVSSPTAKSSHVTLSSSVAATMDSPDVEQTGPGSEKDRQSASSDQNTEGPSHAEPTSGASSAISNSNEAQAKETPSAVAKIEDEDTNMDATLANSSLTKKPTDETQRDSTIEIARSDPPNSTTQTAKDETSEKDSENIKANGDDGKKPVQSPVAHTRRASVASTRRGSSRRASLAANKAEKEREKERELENREEPDSIPEAESEAGNDRTGAREQPTQTSSKDDEDEDEGDMITVNPQSRDRDRRDRRKAEDDDSKTTPKRQANGRFLRKSTR